MRPVPHLSSLMAVLQMVWLLSVAYRLLAAWCIWPETIRRARGRGLLLSEL